MLRLVINLASSVERWESIKAKLDAMGVEVSRLDAVDGHLLDQKTIDSITYPLNHRPTRTRFTRLLTPGEIGCFLSHRKAWQTLLASSEQWCLVIEDDAEFAAHAEDFLQNEDWIPDEAQIIQLSVSHLSEEHRVRNEVIELENGYRLVWPLTPALGTVCYLISRQAAQYALETSQILPCPVDDFLFTLRFDFAHRFRIFKFAPALSGSTESFGSMIGTSGRKQHKTKAPFYLRHGPEKIIRDLRLKMIRLGGKKLYIDFVKRADQK